MNEFDRLSDAERSSRLTALAHAAAATFGLPDETPIRLLNLSENAVFLVGHRDRGELYVLRLHRPGYHTAEGIKTELRWLAALAQHPVISAPRPVPGRDNQFLQEVRHEAVPGMRRAVLFHFIEGAEPASDNGALFEPLGAITAHLHEQSQAWVPTQTGLVRHTWDMDSMFLNRSPLWGRWQDGLGVRGERLRLLEKLEATLQNRLDAYGKAPGRFGLIHTDLRHANLLVHQDTIHALDFDDSGFSWHLYDVAGAVSFIEDQPQVPRLIEAWVRGYRTVRTLPEEDVSEIPTFILARRLLLVAWVGSHQEAPFPRQLGEAFTEGTCRLAEKYLADYQTS